jgi:hypothetical protein
MGWEEINLNEEQEPGKKGSIDDYLASKIPDGWEKTHFGVRNYAKTYPLGITVDIFVLEDYSKLIYIVNPAVKDAQAKKSISEQQYVVETKDAMEQLVMRLVEMYDTTFEKK